LADERATELREEGFVEIGQLYDQSTINKIKEKYNGLIENDEYSEPSQQTYLDEEYNRTICDPLNDFPELLELITDDLIDILENYYESHFRLDTEKISPRRNYHVPPEVAQESEVYSNYWHCDNHSIDRIKLFVYLTDVTEEDGPFHLISKPETKQVVRNKEYSHRERKRHTPGSRIERIADVIRFTGPTGSAALCNTQCCVHRAGVPAEGHHRDLVQLQFEPASEPISKQLAELRE
jgi:hypothetical protein